MLYITILKPNVLYRSRLDKDLSDVTLGYVSSVSDDREIIIYDIIGSQAHVVMLCDMGVIPCGDAAKILVALRGIEDPDAGSEIVGAEDVHEMIEAAVIRDAGARSGGMMHTARSRNDQVALDIRMKIRDDINSICGVLLGTVGALITLAQAHRKTVMPLYTHLQHAQVGTFSHYLLAHADALLRDFGRLSDCYTRVNQNPLGAGPVGGTSIRIDREATSRMLGFSGIVENSIDATSTRDFMAEYVSDLAIMMAGISKMAEDFVIWSSSEFSFIEMSDEFASPSSVMPQKKNPDIMELVRGKTAQTIGGLVAILGTIKGLATGYGRDLQQAKASVWQASGTAASTLAIMTRVISTMRVNQKGMKNASGRGHLMAMDVAERMVQEGVPFRTAHGIVGRLVGHAHAQGRRLDRLDAKTIRKATRGTGVRPDRISDMTRTTTISSSLRDRISLGSSGFAEQKRMIRQREEDIGRCRAALEGRTDHVNDALAGLRARVDEIIGAGSI